ADARVHRWVRAEAGGRLARPDEMASVDRGANDRVAADAHARLADVGLRAVVVVVAWAVVRRRGTGARTGRRSAGAGDVTLIGRRARERVRPDARTRLAHVRPRARVRVVARGSVRGRGVRADPRRLGAPVDRARIAVLTVRVLLARGGRRRWKRPGDQD